MRHEKCCCDWEFVVSGNNKWFYGPIYNIGMGGFPDAKNPGMRMMTALGMDEMYGDCYAHIIGEHNHVPEGPFKRPPDSPWNLIKELHLFLDRPEIIDRGE